MTLQICVDIFLYKFNSFYLLFTFEIKLIYIFLIEQRIIIFNNFDNCRLNQSNSNKR